MFPVTHDELVRRAVHWLRGTKHCRVVLHERTLLADEQPDALGWLMRGLSYLVECKASRADFLRDKHKFFRVHPRRGVGSYRYYLTRPGLLRPDELPADWGLLEAHPRCVRVLKQATVHAHKNRVEELKLLLGVCLRTGGGDPLWVKSLEDGCLPDVGL
jgi:hypothetical protein